MELAKLFVTLSADTSDLISSMNQAGASAGAALNPMLEGARAAEAALAGLTGGVKNTDKVFDDLAREAKAAGNALEGAKADMGGAEHAAEDLAGGLKHADQAAASAHSTFKEMLAAEAVIRVLERAFDAMKDAVVDAVHHLGEVEALNAQTAAAIKSTGAAAGVTSQHIQDMANSIEKATGVEGEAIQRGANLLLTFTNIRDVAGKNNDVFSQATKLMADMSVAMGQDMKSSALQLGKALNDPEKGMTALQRVGVAFTESQKETVKQLQETGHTLEAQKIILKELQTEFGGSAEAYGKTLPGAIERAKAAWENMTDAILGPNLAAMKAGMTILADTINDVADAIQAKGLGTAIYDAFGPNVIAAIVGVGAAIGLAVIPALIGAATAAAPFIATAAVIAFAARPIIQIWGTLPEVMSYVFTTIDTTLTQWYQTVHDVADRVWKAFQAAAQNIGSVFNKLFGGLGTFIADQYSKLPDAVKAPLAGLTGAFKGFVVDVGGAVATIPGMVAGHVAAVGAIGPKFLAGIGSAIGTEFAQAYQIGSTFLGNLQKYIGTFAVEGANGLGHVAKAATDMGHDMGKGGKEAADAAEKQAKAISDTFGKLAADLASLEIDLMLDPAMDALKYLEAQAGALKGALKKLMQEGVDPLDARFAALKNTLRDVNAEIADVKGIDKQIKEIETAIKSLDEHAASVKEAAFMQTALGSAFDATGAALKRANTLLNFYQKNGVEPTDAAVKELVATINRLKEVNQDKVLEDWGKEMTQASEKSFALGKSFDLVGAQASITSKYLTTLSDGGVHAGFAFDTLKASQVGLAPVQAATVSGLAAVKQSITDVLAAVTGLKDGLNTLGEAFGVNLGDSLAGGVAKLGNMGLAVIQVMTSVQALAPAVIELATSLGLATVSVSGTIAASGALGGALALICNPIGAVVAAVAGLVVGGLALINNWDSVAAWGLKFFQGIADAAAKAATFIGNNFHDAGERIKRFFSGGTYQMDLWADKQAEAAFQAQKTTDATNAQIDAMTKLGQTMKNAFAGNAMKAFLDGSKTAGDALRSSVRDAILNGIIEAMAQKKLIESAFGGLFDQLAGYTVANNTAGIAATVSQIGAKIPQVATQMASVLGPIKDAIANAFAPSSFDAMDKVITAAGDAMKKQDFATSVLGQTKEQDLAARIGIVQKALTDLNDAGAAGTNQFETYRGELEMFTKQLEAAKAATAKSSAASSGGGGFIELTGDALRQFDAARAAAAPLPALASGGIATGPTVAMIGEAGPEAVVPLNDASFNRIAGGAVTVNVNYTGSGKWTRRDAEDLGDLLVGTLRQRLGVRQ